MGKYIDVMKQVSDLLETVDEGLQHTQTLLKQGKFEASISLFSDIDQAFVTIEQSVLKWPEVLLTEKRKPVTEKVRIALDKAVEAYETAKYDDVRELLQLTVLPAFNSWKEVLVSKFPP